MQATSKRVVFLGSKPVGYRCFRFLLDQREALGFTVTGLLTQARVEFSGESDLTALAAQEGIPVLESPDAIPDCDILYSVQYHRILTAHQLKKARIRAVNLHMAPLPEYRGANQFSFAILDRKTEFGTTIHLMDPRIDHGDILFQKRFPLAADAWVAGLYEQTVEASVSLFEETLAEVVSGNPSATPQAALEPNYGTALHYKHEMAALKKLDADWPAEKLSRHLRATYMPGFEPPHFILEGRKVFLTPAPDA